MPRRLGSGEAVLTGELSEELLIHGERGRVEPRAGKVERFRVQYRQTVVPARYSGAANLRNNVVLCVGLMILTAALVRSWNALSAAVLVGGLLLFNFSEYAFHRWISHRKRAALVVSYQRHTGQHHGFFEAEEMTAPGLSDYHVTIMPTLTIVAYMVAYMLLIGVPVAVFLGSSAAAAFALAISASLLQLDVLHLYYHLERGAWLSRVLDRFSYFRYLKYAHTHHHDRAQMSKAGFNITHPMFDLIFGTLISEDERGP